MKLKRTNALPAHASAASRSAASLHGRRLPVKAIAAACAVALAIGLVPALSWADLSVGYQAEKAATVVAHTNLTSDAASSILAVNQGLTADNVNVDAEASALLGGVDTLDDLRYSVKDDEEKSSAIANLETTAVSHLADPNTESVYLKATVQTKVDLELTSAERFTQQEGTTATFAFTMTPTYSIVANAYQKSTGAEPMKLAQNDVAIVTDAPLAITTAKTVKLNVAPGFALKEGYSLYLQHDTEDGVTETLSATFHAGDGSPYITFTTNSFGDFRLIAMKANDAAILRSTGLSYPTLQAAIDASAAAGDQVELLKDVTESVVIYKQYGANASSGQPNFKMNLEGHKVTAVGTAPALSIQGATGVLVENGSFIQGSTVGAPKAIDIYASEAVSLHCVSASAASANGYALYATGNVGVTVGGTEEIGSMPSNDLGYFNGKVYADAPCIIGGWFSAAPNEESLQADYIAKAIAQGNRHGGEYEVRHAVIRTVTVKSTARGTASGQGLYEAGSQVTVTVPADASYDFLGWYESGEKKSDQLEYTFTMPERNVNLTAQWTPKAGLEMDLWVHGEQYTVSTTYKTVGGVKVPEIQRGEYYTRQPLGTQITVEYTGTDEFLYWKNEVNKLVSTEKKCTITLLSQTTLVAVTRSVDTSLTRVIFMSPYAQVLSAANCAKDSVATVTVPMPSTKLGCDFLGWTMEYEQGGETVVSEPFVSSDILGALKLALGFMSGDVIYVRPAYEEYPDTYNVTAKFVDGNGTQLHAPVTWPVTRNKVVEISLKGAGDVTLNGYQVKRIKIRNQVVTNSEKFYWCVAEDTEFTFEMVPAGETVAREALVVQDTMFALDADGKKKLVNVTSYSSGDAQMLEFGALITYSASDATEEKMRLEYAGGAVQKFKNSITDPAAVYSMTVNESADLERRVFYRGYATMNVNGQIVTYYSEIVDGTYLEPYNGSYMASTM